jgi:hypothetical protein
MADYPIPPWLHGQDIVGSYNQGVALGQHAAALNQQAQMDNARLEMEQQQANERALERAHQTAIKQQEDQINLGLKRQAMEQRDANAKAALAMRAEQVKAQSEKAAATMAHETANQQYWNDYAKAPDKQAFVAERGAPPHITDFALRQTIGTSTQRTDPAQWMSKQKYIQGARDVQAAERFLNSDIVAGLPEVDPVKVNANAKVKDLKAQLGELEKAVIGGSPQAPAAGTPTHEQAKVALAKQLRSEHPDWPKSKIIEAVNAQAQ